MVESVQELAPSVVIYAFCEYTFVLLSRGLYSLGPPITIPLSGYCRENLIVPISKLICAVIVISLFSI